MSSGENVRAAIYQTESQDEWDSKGAAPAHAISIPVCRPRLPDAEALTPYLRRIDETRIYANHGPLESALEARLSRRFDLPAGCVTLSSSGAMALTGAILGHAGRASAGRPVCLTPAFGFVASAAAAALCGYEVRFVDIDPESWAMDPTALLARPDLKQVGLILPVAPYGRRIDLANWALVQKHTGIPVVIDAAASTDTLVLPRADQAAPPVCLSLHATKSLGAGEGGAILCADADLIRECRAALNHGFMGSRESLRPNTNGKMSEYHAAVGLAAMDALEAGFEEFDFVAASYRKALAEGSKGVSVHLAPEISRTYCLAEFPDAAAMKRTRKRMLERGVETRSWYGPGLHNEPAFRDYPRDNLQNTEDLAGRLLGLPMHRDLTPCEVSQITFLLLQGAVI